MKKVLPYLLLGIYSIMMLKPVMPSITDAAAHLLFYQHHISSIHSHQGKQHVHNEYAAVAQKKEAEKNTAFKKITSSTEFLFAGRSIDTRIIIYTKSYRVCSSANSISGFLPAQFSPPRCS